MTKHGVQKSNFKMVISKLFLTLHFDKQNVFWKEFELAIKYCEII